MLAAQKQDKDVSSLLAVGVALSRALLAEIGELPEFMAITAESAAGDLILSDLKNGTATHNMR